MLRSSIPIRLTSHRRAVAAHLLGSFVLAALAAGCSSTDLSVSAPSTTKCQVTVENTLESVPAAGASAMLHVTTTRDCTWDASSGAPWIEITGAKSGQGSADVTYRVIANADPVARRGHLTVNDTQLAVAQEPAACRFTVTPQAVSIAAAGDSVLVRVDTHPACAWTATADVEWIRVSAGASQAGPGTVTLGVPAVEGPARAATATVAGQTVRVEQEAAPASPVPPPTPGPGPTPPSAPAPSPDPGPTPTPAPDPAPAPDPTTPGSGPAPVLPCAFVVAPSQVSFPAAGGNGSVTVTTTGNCAWTATSGAAWVTVSPASASGPGTVTLVASANTAISARATTVLVAGQTVAVSQAAAAPPCTYILSPSSITVGGAATTIQVAVSTQAGCAWTMEQQDRWLDVGSPGTQTGSGTALVDVQRLNGNSQRVGTMLIAGQTFTVTQNGRNAPQ
jgi:hypothetical protein